MSLKEIVIKNDMVMKEEEAKNEDCGLLVSAQVAKTITIRIRDQWGVERFYKLKETTMIGKLLVAYASEAQVKPTSLRLLLDGERVELNHTPKMLEMDDDDQLDALLEVIGGGGQPLFAQITDGRQ